MKLRLMILNKAFRKQVDKTRRITYNFYVIDLLVEFKYFIIRQ